MPSLIGGVALILEYGWTAAAATGAAIFSPPGPPRAAGRRSAALGRWRRSGEPGAGRSTFPSRFP